MSIVKKGSKGQEVVMLQELLNQALGLEMVADGDFGPRTDNYLRAFQEFAKVPATGAADPKTLEALANYIARWKTVPALITAEQLAKICDLSLPLAQRWVAPLNRAMAEFDISTPARIGAFIANCAHECANFTRLTEGLGYTAIGLANTWPKRYSISPGVPNSLAIRLAKNPEAIANNVYASRMGNGDEASGDGWKFRGRGIIMNTGAGMYLKTKLGIGVDIVNYPDLLLVPVISARAAGHFWKSENINMFADRLDFDGCRDEVNIGRKTEKIGDAIGFAHANKMYLVSRTVLKF